MSMVVKDSNIMDEEIISFLRLQTNMTIAVAENNFPYCANCFYAFYKNENLLVFKSKPETIHVTIALKNRNVAGTIIPDSLNKSRIQGIQFTGYFLKPERKLFSSAKNTYYKKFPFAMVIPGELWAIELLTIKFTDSKAGFGKKMEWKREINSALVK